MNAILFACIATLVAIAIQYIVGRRLGRSGKPYRAFTLVFHIVIALAVLVGVSTINVKIQATQPANPFSVISMGVAGGILWLSILTGIVMAILKKTNKTLAIVHKVSMILIALATLVNAVMTALKI